MDELKECCMRTLDSFVLASWKVFPDETKKAFEALAKAKSPLPIIQLTYETKADRPKTNSSLAALEALQLINWIATGNAKSYEITEFGLHFAENIIKVI